MALELALFGDRICHKRQGESVDRENTRKKSTGKGSRVQNTPSRLCSLSLGCVRGKQSIHRWTGARGFR